MSTIYENQLTINIDGIRELMHSQTSKMKTLTVLLVLTVFTINIAGYLIKVPTEPIVTPTVTANTRWVHLQKLMIPLFENVCEDSSDPVIRRLAQEFTLDSTDYVKPEVISNLQNLMSNGLLPKGKIFTEYNSDHLNELQVIYEVLYNAKNFDAFYKTAAWARQNCNCGLYVNALYLAVQNRRDTVRLSIPAPYELLPNYFISKDVIIEASSLLSGEEINPSESIRYEGNIYTLDANYTAAFYDNEDDSKLAYFREDIGLNSYYFLRKLKMAPWFNNNVNGTFGENIYHMMKQLNARYNLERYANGLPEVDSLNWRSLPDIPYDPMLIYSDGNEFSHRTSLLNVPENEDLLMIETIENNIVAVVNHMRQSGYNKTQILNHLMEILVTSDRSFDTVARQLLGKDLNNNGHASVLEHYMTSLRDPMFWKINKKIVDMVDEALKILPTYSRNELYFPGVEIVNIDVKKTTTACDYFQFDVTDALKIDNTNSKFKIRIGQPRLNHKPFTVKLNISSLVTQKGLAKVYLGPKLLPGELADKKNLFTLLDVFEINLKTGTNIITRTSDSMKHFSDDFLLLDTIRKIVEDADFGLDSLPLTTVESQTGFPSRLILPKGTPQGLPLQMFVFVAPFVKASLGDAYSRNIMEFNSALLSPGYPLDLIIEDRQLFGLPNAMVKYITIIQKSDSKIENYGGPGITKTWYGTDTYDPSSRPNCNSKKGQYGGYNDYPVKVNDFNTDINDIVPDDRTDYYEVVGVDEKSNLLKESKFDYTSKRKVNEPFDYKAKKAQFDKNDYSGKRDFSQYRTKSKINIDIPSTTIFDTFDTTEKNFNIAMDNSYANLENSNKDHKDFVPTVMDSLEVEPLPLPAKLKKDPEQPEKIDYKIKKKERDYNIKVKKISLDTLIKEAKMKSRLLKPLTDTTPTSSVNILDFGESTEKIILSKDVIKIKDKTPKDSKSKIIDNNIKNNDFEKNFGTKANINENIFNITKDKAILDVMNSSEENVKEVNFSRDNVISDKVVKDHVVKPLQEVPTIDSTHLSKENEMTKNEFDQEKSFKVSDNNIEDPDSDKKSNFIIETLKKRFPKTYQYTLMHPLGITTR